MGGFGGSGRTQTLPSSCGVRSAGAKAVERIDDEGQLLEVDLDFLDRFGAGELVDSGHGENRLAHDRGARW